MARFNQIVNSFTLGEVSPRSYGRTDLELYRRSCQELTNAIVHPQGGVSRRPGGKYYGDTLPTIGSIPEDIRMIPFIFSREEAYQVILTTGTSDNLEIINTKTLKSCRIIETTANTATPTQDFSQFTEYSASALKEVQYSQSGDVMFFAHSSQPPWYLTRIADDVFVRSWAFWDIWDLNGETPTFKTTVELVRAWPFTDVNETEITLISSDTSGSTETISASAGGSDFYLFDEGHIGSIWAIVNSGTIGYFLITGMSGTASEGKYKTANINILSNLPANTDSSGHSTWHEPMWSDYRGWPRSVTFFEQRSIFGGNEGFPDTIWGSQTGNIHKRVNDASQIDSSSDVVNTDPFKETMASNEVNEIQWLNSGKQITIGTLGSEIISNGRDPEQSLGPLNPGYSDESSAGSKYVQSVKVGNSVLFVQRSGHRVFEFVFDARENSFRASDITQISEHISKKSIEEYSSAYDSEIICMQYQKANDEIVWMIDSNGGLFALTKDRLNGVNAWHWHELGGELSNENTKVLSISAVPSPNATHDELWLVSQRTIDGSTVQFIEIIGRPYLDSSISNSSKNINDKPVYMDSSRLYIQDSDLTFRATFRDSIDAEIADGTATGTGTGSGFISNKRLDLDGNKVDYSATDNADHQQIITIRFLVSPKYSGIPAGPVTYYLFTLSEADSSDNSEISLTTGSSDNLTLTIKDSSGSTILDDNIVTDWSPNENSWYLIELNIDLTNGNNKAFVNGEEVWSDTSTGTRGAVGLLRLGSDYTDTLGADHYMQDFQIYSSLKNTEAYNPYSYFGLTEYIQPGTSVQFLDHLEGEDVVVVSDGSYDNEYTVSSGSITVSEAFSWALIGLNYQTVITPLTADAGSQTGSAHGLIKRFDRLAMRFMRTIGAKFGRDKDNLDDVEFDTDSDPTPMFTGLITEDFPGTYDEDAAITITQDLPLPFTLTSAIMRGVTYD